MVAPRPFVHIAPAATGTISLLSLLPAPQESHSPSPFMGFTTTRRCGRTQRYDGHGRRGWDALSRPAPPLLSLGDSCPLVDWRKEFDPTCPGPGALSAGV